MYGVVDREYIRKQHFREGWSIRKIARQLGMCRKTVRRLLEDSQVPTYTLKGPRPRPVTGPYLEVIRTWLTEDLQAPRRLLIIPYGLLQSRSFEV